MRFPLIAAVLVPVAVLLAAPPLTAQRAPERETIGEPHEVNRAGRDIVEYTSDRLQVVAVHYYFPEGHDPKWLLLDVADGREILFEFLLVGAAEFLFEILGVLADEIDHALVGNGRRILGEAGGLEWSQIEPNSLVVRWPDRPYEVRRTGGPGVSEAATGATRLPAGHPEGFLEAFALLYRNFADTLEAKRAGRQPTEENLDFPTIADGVRGMAFIETVVESAKSGAQWLAFKD